MKMNTYRLNCLVLVLLLLVNMSLGEAGKDKKSSKTTTKMKDPESVSEEELLNQLDLSSTTSMSTDDAEAETENPDEGPEGQGDSTLEGDQKDSSKKSVKNFTCQVTGALISMANSIKELDNDIKAIKNQMFEKCPGFDANQTESIDTLEDSLDALNATDDKTELEDGVTNKDGGEDSEELLPPIPTECDKPFQPVANSCYYFLYYPPDWKTWGDANAYCQTFGGTLAAPYRLGDLREYLKKNFSNVFWVGAKRSITKPDSYDWLTGKELVGEDWKEGHPSKAAAKFCVYLEFFSGYKAINHYCGEKFSFVCEKRVELE